MRTLLLIIGLYAIAPLSAQTTLKFCADTGKDGTCKVSAAQFSVTKDGGTISFLLKGNNALGFADIVYKIYKLEENGDETYASGIEQKLKKEWTYAWQEAVFYDEGTYKIKVYDITGDEFFVCSNILKIVKE